MRKKKKIEFKLFFFEGTNLQSCKKIKYVQMKRNADKNYINLLILKIRCNNLVLQNQIHIIRSTDLFHSNDRAIKPIKTSSFSFNTHLLREINLTIRQKSLQMANANYSYQIKSKRLHGSSIGNT